MSRIQDIHTRTYRTGQGPFTFGRALWLAVPIVAVALILVLTAQGRGPLHYNDDMARVSQTMPACPPKEEIHRIDTLNLRAKGLLPNTAFTVLLTGLEDSRSGAANYVGELQTNDEGRGAMRFDAVVDSGQNLNHAVLRLSNPLADDFCFTPVTSPISLFDKRRTASVATIFISESRSIDDNASLFHTVNWRSIKCVSTF